MSKRCTYVEADGFHQCGSFAFNLWREGIDQGEFCDVHYWQHRAERADTRIDFVLAKLDVANGRIVELEAWLHDKDRFIDEMDAVVCHGGAPSGEFAMVNIVARLKCRIAELEAGRAET